jgi:hypothetical protein
MNDANYLRREIDQQCQKLVAEPGLQEPRLSLIRSLLRSDAGSAPERLREMIERVRTGTELELVTRLAAPQGRKFVFQFPQLVRLLLTRGTDLGVAAAVRRTLRLSVCGGGRSFSEADMDPEYRHILTEAESLANRFRDDQILAAFYRMIAESERIESAEVARHEQTTDLSPHRNPPSLSS